MIVESSKHLEIAYSKFGKIILGYDLDMIANDSASRYMRTGRRSHYLFDRKRLWITQNGLCFWCRKSCVFDGLGGNSNQFTVDHVIPVGFGGTNHWKNLVGACHGCNNKRGKKWQEYRIVPLIHLDKEELLV